MTFIKQFIKEMSVICLSLFIILTGTKMLHILSMEESLFVVYFYSFAMVFAAIYPLLYFVYPEEEK